ncbi:MAG TPA: thioredoxin domain-containing protein [Polyangiaceae bacterium]|nr:thioredoxin domain-containing protein [Polyangiaceae bacterium]
MNLSEPSTTVNELTFDNEVLEADRPVLVDVAAAWCAPCRAAEPVLAELARQRASTLKVVRIDGEESPALVARLGVRGYPTFLLYEHGRELKRQAGFRGANALRDFVTR